MLPAPALPRTTVKLPVRSDVWQRGTVDPLAPVAPEPPPDEFPPVAPLPPVLLPLDGPLVDVAVEEPPFALDEFVGSQAPSSATASAAPAAVVRIADLSVIIAAPFLSFLRVRPSPGETTEVHRGLRRIPVISTTRVELGRCSRRTVHDVQSLASVRAGAACGGGHVPVATRAAAGRAPAATPGDGDFAGFVGRDDQLARLESLRDRREVTLRAALVEGPAGIGKSRLLREFARRSEQGGMRVLMGHAGEVERAVPFS